MSQQYNADYTAKNAKSWMSEHTDINLIIEFCKRILDYGLSRGLPVDGLVIFLRSSMKKTLNMGEYLIVEYQDVEYHFSVVEDNRIIEHKMDDGVQTDVLIYNPEWGENEPTV